MGGPSAREVFEAFDGYWERSYPKVKRVVFENWLQNDRTEAMRLCRETEGNVDIVSYIRPLDTLKVAESPYAKVVKSRDVTWFGVWFNQRKKESKWRDIRLRKAISYAINREELLKYAAKGNAYNLGGSIPPGAYGHNPELTPHSFNAEKAKTLLSEAGYPNGFKLKAITFEAWRLEAQIICKMLERIALEPSLEVLSWPAYFQKMYVPALKEPPEKQEWDLSISDTQDYYGHTAASFLTWGPLEESDIRWMEYNPSYQAKWKDLVTTRDRDIQERKIRHLSRYLHDKFRAISIYSPISLYAVNKEVNFVPQKDGHMRLKETSVTENHWSVRGKNN